MFDMKEIGARIARYRRQKNLTQMMLADKLNISFQAVSNWERGESMPDISKLGELSQALGVSIDVLLGNLPQNTDTVGPVEKLPEENEVEVDADPEVEVKVEIPEIEVDENEPNDSRQESFRRIRETIEFIDSDDIAGFVKALLSQGMVFEEITPAIEYLDSDEVAEIVTECLKNGETLSDMNIALDYMDSDDIADIVRIALEHGESFDAVSFAFEYMDSDDITEVLKTSVKKNSSKKTKEAHYDDLAREVESKEKDYETHAAKVLHPWSDVFDKAKDLFAPFTKKEEKQNFETYTVDTETGEVKETSSKVKNLKDICTMFPFMPADEVTNLAKESYEAGAEFNSLNTAFPFMHRNVIEEIVICELKKGVSINKLSSAFPFVSVEFLKKIAKGEY